jgi:nicotinamide riboside transporter PnuC
MESIRLYVQATIILLGILSSIIGYSMIIILIAGNPVVSFFVLIFVFGAVLIAVSNKL